MLKPVERPSRIPTLGFKLFIAWVPPKSERTSSTCYVAGCDATSRRAARPTENSPEISPCPPASRFISLTRVDISLTKPLLFNSICYMVEIMPLLPFSKAALKVLIRACNAVALVSKFEIEDA